MFDWLSLVVGNRLLDQSVRALRPAMCWSLAESSAVDEFDLSSRHLCALGSVEVREEGHGSKTIQTDSA